ncbi:MAG: hypothetical protein ACSHXZ_08515 [Gammaproteobacteria bacterium]
MSQQKNSENSTQNATMSLDQLSDTIEVMTGVINRLKHHLHVQLSKNDTENKAEALNSALLSNERELQELHRLAQLQKQSVDSQLDAPTREADTTSNESDEATLEQTVAQESSFIIEIAQHEESDDLSTDRILH